MCVLYCHFCDSLVAAFLLYVAYERARSTVVVRAKTSAQQQLIVLTVKRIGHRCGAVARFVLLYSVSCPDWCEDNYVETCVVVFSTDLAANLLAGESNRRVVYDQIFASIWQRLFCLLQLFQQAAIVYYIFIDQQHSLFAIYRLFLFNSVVGWLINPGNFILLLMKGMRHSLLGMLWHCTDWWKNQDLYEAVCMFCLKFA